MKKCILLICLVALAVSACSADEAVESQQPPAEQAKKVVTEVTLKETEPDFLVGKVESIATSDLTRPTSKLVITGIDGEPVEFSVRALAVVYEPRGGIMPLSDLRQSQKVQVNYRMKDGIKEATAIKILPEENGAGEPSAPVAQAAPAEGKPQEAIK